MYHPVCAVILQNIHGPTIKLPSPNRWSFIELPSHRLVVTIAADGILLLKLYACSAMIWRYYVFARTCVILRIRKRNIGEIFDVQNVVKSYKTSRSGATVSAILARLTTVTLAGWCTVMMVVETECKAIAVIVWGVMCLILIWTEPNFSAI